MSIRSHAANEPTLSELTHRPKELTLHALTFFDKPITEWTVDQTQAIDRFNTYIHGITFSTVSDNTGSITEQDLSWCIDQIGKVFYLDGLQNVECRWIDTATLQASNFPKNTLAITSRDRAKNSDVCVEINREAWLWKHSTQNARRILLRDNLLHEAAHAFFRRFATETGAAGDGTPLMQIPFLHHSAWQVLVTVQRDRLRSHYNWDVKLLQGDALMSDFESTGVLDLTETDLEFCFGDLFKYIKAKRTKKSIEGWKIKHDLVLRSDVLYWIANLRSMIKGGSVELKRVTAQPQWRQEVIDWKTTRAAQGMEAQVSRWGWRG